MITLDDITQRRKDLIDRYKRLKEQNDAALLDAPPPAVEDYEGVRQAQEDAQKQAQDFALMQGLNQAANQMGSIGGQVAKTDLSSLDAINKAAINQANNDALNIDKRQKMFQDITNRGTQAAEQEVAQAQDVYNQEQLNAPINQETRNLMQTVLTQASPQAKLPEVITPQTLKDNPWMTKLLDSVTQTNKFANRPIKKINPTDNKLHWYQRQPDGSFEDLGQADYAPGEKIDLQTGAKVRQGNALNTETLETSKTKKFEESKASSLGSQQAKDINEAQAQQAAQEKLNQTLNNAMELYNNSKYKGALAGRLAKAAQARGISIDPNATKLIVELQRNANEYIAKMSGAAVSTQEAERLNIVLPQITDDATTFKSKIEAYRNEIQKIVNEKRAKAEMPPATSTPNAPVNQPTSTQRRIWKP